MTVDLVSSALSESELELLSPESTIPEIEKTLNALRDRIAPLTPLQRELGRAGAIRLLTDRGLGDARRLVIAALADLNGNGTHAAGEAQQQGQAVALEDPAPWTEPVNGAALLDEIAGTFAHYVALPPGAATVLALWTVHAHAHEAATVSPLLALTSPEKRSAKTTTLTLLGAVVPRSLTAANVSPAAVFRTVEKYSPTIILDEADTVFRVNDELRCMFNASHTRAAAVVVRVVGEDMEPRLFSTWCPKALALIGDLPGTLEDRAIVIPMRRRRPEERVARLRLDRLGQLEPLRRRAWRWAQDNADALRGADPAIPETLHDRAADNWRPLLAVADVAGGPWPEWARRAAVLLSGGVLEGEQAPAVQLLADVRELFAERGADRLASADVVAALTQREDRPWPEWRHGRPLTVRQLAKLLARFGVSPTQLRVGSGKVRGYELAAFSDSFARYLPSDPVQAVQVSNGVEKRGVSDPVQGELVPDADSPENPHGVSIVPDVPDGEGGPGLDPDEAARAAMREGA